MKDFIYIMGVFCTAAMYTAVSNSDNDEKITKLKKQSTEESENQTIKNYSITIGIGKKVSDENCKEIIDRRYKNIVREFENLNEVINSLKKKTLLKEQKKHLYDLDLKIKTFKKEKVTRNAISEEEINAIIDLIVELNEIIEVQKKIIKLN